MRYQRQRLWAPVSLVLCVVSAVVLGACALTPGSTSTSRGVPGALSMLQTRHQEFVAWRETSSGCASETPPPVAVIPADQALVGQQTWASGGVAGQECQTTTRIYMAGMRFTSAQLGTQAPAHAQLQLHLDPLVQPSPCIVELGIVQQNWEQEDPSQGPAAPYASIPLSTPTYGPPSAHTVTIESRTQTVSVDVTSVVQGWVTQQKAQPGFELKTPYGCTLIHVTQVKLLLEQ